MYVDKVTQIISHFIGEFEVGIENARLKQLYEEFAASRKAAELSEELPDADVSVNPSYQLIDYQPDIPYVPKVPELLRIDPTSEYVYVPPAVELPEVQALRAEPMFVVPSSPIKNSNPILQPTPEPPGSVAVVIEQTIHLTDNDYVSVGGHGLSFNPAPADDAMIDAMLGELADLSPIDDLTLEDTDGDIGDFIVEAAARLDSMPDHPDVTIVKGENVDGTYVNGKTVSEAPDLEDYSDYLAKQKDDEQDEEKASEDEGEIAEFDANAHFNEDGELEVDVSVALDTGSNTLVNTCVLTNSWATSNVMAVVGDSVELNAIIQINTICDANALGDSLNGWMRNDDDAEGLFNIAMFKHIEAQENANSAADAHEFPKDWIVTEVEGDLTILNWIEQFTFMIDNDVAILSSSGVTTKVGTGENVTINDVTLEELGLYYDLIIVGGNIYDANIILQSNILLDNDLIGAVEGFETNGLAKVSQGANLLWNQAAIAEVGGNSYQPMSKEYWKAANGLEHGNDGHLKGLLDDQAFQGLETLRVLYVSGDINNLNYVKQTNILGDSDQVALAMNELFPHPEADWTLSTGNNELINFAAIVDVDGASKTYVGGDRYSDEILVQGNLLSDDPVFGSQDPDALVNEAIAFLADDGGSDDGYEPTIVPMPMHDHAHGELMPS